MLTHTLKDPSGSLDVGSVPTTVTAQQRVQGGHKSVHTLTTSLRLPVSEVHYKHTHTRRASKQKNYCLRALPADEQLY